ncbi:hypothetical protein WMY93_008296 [Mugilogobius chulae]|uniref:G-protein coupled receptors family 1 profile domain-containing protein n=1 Tax=Mugilogobius chulae TaxID=88201 RepID=A0AAW0PGS4_9GOBI
MNIWLLLCSSVSLSLFVSSDSLQRHRCLVSLSCASVPSCPKLPKLRVLCVSPERARLESEKERERERERGKEVRDNYQSMTQHMRSSPVIHYIILSDPRVQSSQCVLFAFAAAVLASGRAELDVLCPLGQFPCGNMSECLPQALQCNGHKDCPNGADERLCGDNAGWADLFGRVLQNTGPVQYYTLTECLLQEFPEACECTLTDVMCVRAGLQDVPKLSSNVTWLSLRSNKIRRLSDYVFSEYSALERLFLQNNSLHFISRNAFNGLYSLKRLFLSENLISSLSPGVFKDLRQLEWLMLDHNPLTSLSQDTFFGLQSLVYLSMVHTSLKQLPHPSFCQHLPSLDWLDLEGNQIKTLNYSILKTCSKLEVLLLMDNRINSVPENTFQSLWKLAELNLSSNRIRELPKNTFKSLSKSLLKLNISHNPLLRIHSGHFSHLTQLQSLALEGIEIQNIQTKMFLPMKNLSYIYFKTFKYCSYAPHVRSCKPKTDGFLPLRTFGQHGAAGVSLGHGFHHLLWEPPGHRHEVPDPRRKQPARRLHQSALLYDHLYLSISVLLYQVVLSSIWLMGFIIAAVPLMNEDIFGNYYGRNGVCFPLHSDRQEKPTAKGYSTGIFLGLNLVAFLMILCCYSSMFYSIYKTGLNATDLRSRLHKDVAVANRFFFIVFSDALCWIPIFLVKVLSLLEVEIPGTISSWVVIFILPINSALNPILYTLTTSFFREQVELLLCRWQRRHTLKKDRKSLTSSTIFMEGSRGYQPRRICSRSR